MNNSFKKIITLIKNKLLLLCLFFAIGAQASLLEVEIKQPLFFFDKDLTVTKSTTYNESTNEFRISADPLVLSISGSYKSVSDTSSLGPKKLSINIQVDESGQLIGGSPNDDLVLKGAVNGQDGILLTGEITGFGYNNSGTTDNYDMTFSVTGGLLATEYPGGIIAISMSSEASSFDGDFTSSFSGDAKGNLGRFDPQPNVALCTLVSINGVDYLDADNISADECDIYPQTIPAGILGELDATYKYVIINTGQEALTNITLTDDYLGSIDVPVGFLNIGDSVEITFDSDPNNPNNKLFVADRCNGVAGLVPNIGTVKATGESSGQLVTDDDPANVKCNTQPDISLRKEVSIDGGPFLDANTESSAAVGVLGSQAEYRLIVQNTGNETLINVLISDSELGIDNLSIGNLSPNDEVIITSGTSDFNKLAVDNICDSIGNFTNVAEVTADGEISAIPVNSSDPANVVCQQPQVKIINQVSLDGVSFFDADQSTDPDVPVGIIAQASGYYRYIVTNIGSENLTNVVINDPNLGVTVNIADLAVGESRTLNSTDQGFESLFIQNLCTDASNKLNIVSVNAIGEESKAPVSDNDPANVRCILGPAIQLLNQVSLTDGAPFFDADQSTDPDVPVGQIGADATYRYIIRNIGDEPLKNIVLNDPALVVVNEALSGLELAPGGEVIVDFKDTIYTLDQLFVIDRCDAIGNKLNIATVTANGVFTDEQVTDDDPANVNCVTAPKCSLSLNSQCAIVEVPPSDDLLCQARIQATTLRYTGPSISGATVTIAGKDGGSETYSNVDLISGVTSLTSANQNNYTIDSTTTGNDSLGSQTFITINGVEEIIHTSCSAVYVAGQPAPLDSNTPNPPNSDKGDPSPNWHVVNFLDQDGAFVEELTGTPGPVGSTCEVISSTPVDVINYYTVTNTGGTNIEITSLFDSLQGEILEMPPVLLAPNEKYSTETTTVASGSSVISSSVLANVSGSAATCEASSFVTINVEPPQEPVDCSDIKDITSLSMIWNGPDGVDIETENGQVFTNVQNGNQITFDVFENDTDLFITGAVTGTSRFHRSCSDAEMDGNNDCGMAQGDGKDNHSDRLNLFLLDGMTGETGSFACGLDNTGVVEPTAAPQPIDCSDIKDITSLSMIWNGASGVDIETENGQLFSNVQNGNKITFDVLENDTDLFISGAVTGTSRFHKSCSDADMDGNNDCGTAQGNGKDNNSGLVNSFLLDGMTGVNGSFSCDLANSGEVTPTDAGPSNGDVINAIKFEITEDKLYWTFENTSKEDLFLTDITVVWPAEHNFIEKIKLEKDFAKVGTSSKMLTSPSVLSIADFESDPNKRKLKKEDHKRLEVVFKEKYPGNSVTDYNISVTFSNGQTFTLVP
ncbi:hypothetical protein [Thalassotalea aquiviva]|uniref:hypothetical protein n=1 Tax=Thalassotalea aquiviva TaxID=3242415 RepID=UPI00352A93F2